MKSGAESYNYFKRHLPNFEFLKYKKMTELLKCGPGILVFFGMAIIGVVFIAISLFTGQMINKKTII
ncbi:MAG: hypothetical protein ABIW86_14315 [Flavobacterium sp.]